MSRVAIYGGGGSPYNHAAILAQAGHKVRFTVFALFLGTALAITLKVIDGQVFTMGVLMALATAALGGGVRPHSATASPTISPLNPAAGGVAFSE